jgi:hypothetical protein
LKWITREHVKVDRVACPWLIKRFIDPAAQFEFLPKETDWSSVKHGILFDVPGCELGHKGKDVSFDSILNKYGLNDPGSSATRRNRACCRFTSKEFARGR